MSKNSLLLEKRQILENIVNHIGEDLQNLIKEKGFSYGEACALHAVLLAELLDSGKVLTGPSIDKFSDHLKSLIFSVVDEIHAAQKRVPPNNVN